MLVGSMLRILFTVERLPRNSSRLSSGLSSVRFCCTEGSTFVSSARVTVATTTLPEAMARSAFRGGMASGTQLRHASLRRDAREYQPSPEFVDAVLNPVAVGQNNDAR
jgi:hypothetical protein